MLKAIETSYKGYRFRSRLEARWAVFFDRLELLWEYEPEGYQTEHGWYLPDFKVRSHHHIGRDETPDEWFTAWFEVRPAGAALGGLDRERDFGDKVWEADRLSGLFLLQGPPEHFDYETHFCECNSGPRLGTHNLERMSRWYFTTRFDHPSRTSWEETRLAVQAAKSARFEHGETPK